MDITELLTAKADSKQTETEAVAPDPAVDPQGALDFHRALWPLNDKVAKGKLPEAPEGSERVRLRRLSEELAEGGVVFTGNFAAERVPDADVTMGGSFSGSGELWNGAWVTIHNPGPDARQMTEMIQQALQGWGFAAIVGMDGMLMISKAGDPEEVTWDECGLRPGYTRYGATKPTPAQMLQYHTVLSKSKTRHVRSVADWAGSSYDPQQSLEWTEHGVSSPQEAKVWEGLGLDAAGAKLWLSAGISSDQAGKWMAGGYTLAQAKPWNDICRRYEQSKAWIDAGYNPAQAGMWIRFHHDLYPEKVKPLLDAKIGAKQLDRLSAAGCGGSDLEPLMRWVERYKIDLPEALRWAELGPEFIGPGKRGRWHKAGFSPDDIRVWQRALGGRRISVNDVQAKIEAGFDPKQGATWAAIHSRFSNPGLVAGWTKQGLTPDDAKPWIEISQYFCDYEIVAEWTAAGLGTADAKPWVEANENFVYRYKVEEWQKAHPALKDNPTAAAELSRITQPHNLVKILEVLRKAE